MKKTALISVLLAAVLLAGCVNLTFGSGAVIGSGRVKSEIRQVSGFTAVTLATSGDLIVTTGSEDMLTISADDNILPYLTSDVVNETLGLSTKPNTSITTLNPIKYTLTVKSLSGIKLLGSGDANIDALSGDAVSIESAGSGILSLGTLTGNLLHISMLGSGDVKIAGGKADSASVIVAGSGDLRAESLTIGAAGSSESVSISSLGSGKIFLGGLTVKSLNVNLNGSGDVTLGSGSADEVTLEILGSGSYMGGDMKAATVQAKLLGSGSATIWATETLNSSLLGSGDLSYYGSPAVTSSELGSGRVRGLGAK